MQVQADWRQQMTPETFNHIFTHPFAGSGFYLTNTDTVLVVPLPPNDAPTVETVWKKLQPENTLYDVHVFNCNFRETIFAAIALAPTRVDLRP